MKEKEIHLRKFREVYTSTSWMVRIYEVLDEENLAPPYQFDEKYDRSILNEPDPEHQEDSKIKYAGGIEYGWPY